jgi:rod shape-determining protein MreB
MRKVKNMSDRLYVGIDLGTYQSTIASSAGISHTIETVVGRPKDPVARNFLGRDVLFGNDALKNKLACNLYRPMAAGVAQDDEANLAAAKAFLASSAHQATFHSLTNQISLLLFEVK